MSKERMLFILGIWVALLPYLGFPYFIKNILFSVSGLVLIYFSYVMYRKNRAKGDRQKNTFDNFSENTDFLNGGEEDNIQN